jgi:hypothetical protein
VKAFFYVWAGAKKEKYNLPLGGLWDMKGGIGLLPSDRGKGIYKGHAFCISPSSQVWVFHPSRNQKPREGSTLGWHVVRVSGSEECKTMLRELCWPEVVSATITTAVGRGQTSSSKGNISLLSSDSDDSDTCL